MKNYENSTNFFRLRNDIDSWKFSHNIKTYKRSVNEKVSTYLDFLSQKPKKIGALPMKLI